MDVGCVFGQGGGWGAAASDEFGLRPIKCQEVTRCPLRDRCADQGRARREPLSGEDNWDREMGLLSEKDICTTKLETFLLHCEK